MTVIDSQEYGADAEGVALRITPFGVGWGEKHYTLRKTENGEVKLRDDDEGHDL
jgi:hypothetical protein